MLSLGVRWSSAVLVVFAGCGRIGFDGAPADASSSVPDSGTSASSCSEEATHSLFHSGSGAPDDPFVICTAKELVTIGKNKTSWAQSFTLEADIDLAAFDGQSLETSYDAIGYLDPEDLMFAIPFSGAFAGNDHVISNLKIDIGSSNQLVGLFGYTDGANLTDIRLENVNISSSGGAGGLVGKNDNTPISNCTVSGTINGTLRVGGLVGQNFATRSGQSSDITNCHSDVVLTAVDSVGGLVGHNSADDAASAEIIDSSSIGAVASAVVDGANTFGGLIGYNRAYDGSSVHTIRSFTRSSVTRRVLRWTDRNQPRGGSRE